MTLIFFIIRSKINQKNPTLSLLHISSFQFYIINDACNIMLFYRKSDVHFCLMGLDYIRNLPESVEYCICLKDYLDGAARIQHLTTLEVVIDANVKTTLHNEEVELGISTPNED